MGKIFEAQGEEGEMRTKWNKRLKDRFGYSFAKTIFIPCNNFDKKCFRPHDWNHDGHLVCVTNANSGCPDSEIAEQGRNK